MNKPRRILIFSLMYSPFMSGGELAPDEITRRISKEDIHFDLIALRADRRLSEVEQVGNVTLHRIGPAKEKITFLELGRFPWYLIKVLYIPLAVLKARQLMRKRTYDAYWCIMTNMGFVPVILRMFFGDKTPFVLTLQDGDTREHIVERKRIKFFGRLFRHIFTDAACVQAISRHLAVFAKDMGYPGEPSIIPNGVAVAEYINAPSDAIVGVTQELEKKKGEIFLVTTSRLVEKNGLGDVVAALPLLDVSIRFVVLGDGPLLHELQKQAERLGVRDRVVFLGNVSRELVPAYLHASDIFIRPSLSEGLGSSFLEAMAAGLPVIATPVGGIPDFLFDIEEYDEKATGVFCQPHNPESIAFAVKRLIKDVGMRQKISQNGRALVLEKYDWDLVARSMKEVFEQVSVAEK
ncbi:glycosyltransferase family 4 protein [Candidatus Campbellbacteria bacterium]|nr:MAG: glycosyltransferase family 4 protein [Candidatus Campbellbacteria bacterium]